MHTRRTARGFLTRYSYSFDCLTHIELTHVSTYIALSYRNKHAHALNYRPPGSLLVPIAEHGPLARTDWRPTADDPAATKRVDCWAGAETEPVPWGRAARCAAGGSSTGQASWRAISYAASGGSAGTGLHMALGPRRSRHTRSRRSHTGWRSAIGAL